jgi:membrane protein implicated in regulation of membrane protease activity
MTLAYASRVITLVVLVLAVLFLPWPWSAVAVIGAAIVDLAETGAFLWWSRRRRRLTRPAVGLEDLVGRSAVVVTPLRPEGQVRVVGELWRARGAPQAAPGERVVVRGVSGMVLEVERGG